MRLFLGAILYLAQGLPQGLLFVGVPAWLAANGQGAGVIGSVIAAITLPWSLKFILGAVLDRYTFLPMGRRRSWLVGAQFGIIASMLIFAVINPSANAIPLVIAFAFIMSLLTATQDVALDAMVIDLTPPDEMGNVNGFMFGGKIIGIAGGAAVTGFLSEHYGFGAALYALALIFAIPAVFALLVRERVGEKLLPWSNGAASKANFDIIIPAWVPLLKATLVTIWRKDALVVIFLAFTYAFHQAAGEVLYPLLTTNYLGWGEAKYTALVGLSNLLLAPIAFVAGGQIIDRFGPKIIACLMGLSAGGALLAYAMMEAQWSQETVFYVAYFAINIPGLLAYLTMLVLMMRVSDPKVAATSFTIMSSAHAFGMVVAGPLMGPVDDWGGYQAIMLFSAFFIALSGVSALLLSQGVGGSKATHAAATRGT